MQQRIMPPKWFVGWVLLPILAHLISMKTGFIAIGLYLPLWLPIAQWYALKRHPANNHPAYWFTTIPFLFLSGYVIRLLNLPTLKTDISVGLILAFYLSQCLAELVLCSMFSHWRWGWFLAANVVASLGWYQLFLAQHYAALEYTATNIRINKWLYGDDWYYLTIPAIACLTNLITGLGLLKATQTNT